MHFELLLYPLGRFLGFFLFSPLFASRSVPVIIRLGLTLTLLLLIAPLFLESPPRQLGHSNILAFIGEFFIGFLLGLFFSLLIESAELAGGVIGTLSGFSALEILDPTSLETTPLIAKVFGLVAVVLFITLDLHHLLLKFLYESFYLIPIGSFIMPSKALFSLFEAAGELFQMALAFAVMPGALLVLVLLFLAFLARAFPSLPLFWLSFPLQLLIGLFVMGLAFAAFPEIVLRNFNILKEHLSRILLALSTTL